MSGFWCWGRVSMSNCTSEHRTVQGRAGRGGAYPTGADTYPWIFSIIHQGRDSRGRAGPTGADPYPIIIVTIVYLESCQTVFKI